MGNNRADAVSVEVTVILNTSKHPVQQHLECRQGVGNIYRLEHLLYLLECDIIPSPDIARWTGLQKEPGIL